jgi:hypothetical protein
MSDLERLRRLVITCGAVYGLEPDDIRRLPYLHLMRLARSIMAIAEHKRRIAELTNGFQGSRR